jgi:hypothetical protein
MSRNLRRIDGIVRELHFQNRASGFDGADNEKPREGNTERMEKFHREDCRNRGVGGVSFSEFDDCAEVAGSNT